MNQQVTAFDNQKCHKYTTEIKSVPLRPANLTMSSSQFDPQQDVVFSSMKDVNVMTSRLATNNPLPKLVSI